MVSTTASKFFLLAVAAFAASADAHSKMSLPKPTWDNGYGTNSPSGTIDGPTALKVPSGMSFSTDPTSNTKAYTAAIKNSNYGSLKALAFATQKTESGATKECGFSKTNGVAQPLPDTVQWDELTSSHEGPCEVWCDNTMAFHDDNCAKNYPGSPAKLPYDKSKCSGAKMLMSIWLALHTPTWQVYTNCAPIGSGGGSAATSGSTSTSTGGNTGGNNNNNSNNGGSNSNNNNSNNGGSNNNSNNGGSNNNNNSGGSSSNNNKNNNNKNNSNNNNNSGGSSNNSNKNNNNNSNNKNNNNNNNNQNNGNRNSGGNNNNNNGWGNWGANGQQNGGSKSWTFGK
ncbi:hypothetical protein FI667_g9288, partial [Globisporangium splendens]